MKNKKLIYLLAPLTLIIWGMIAYNIYSHFRSPEFLEEDYTDNLSKKVDIQQDTAYSLLANYRDPFLGGFSGHSDVTLPKKTLDQPVSNPDVWVNWPMIEFKGVILNEKKKVAIIRIENANCLMNEGDEMKQVKLIRMYNDSVLLLYQNSRKSFKKNTGSVN